MTPHPRTSPAAQTATIAVVGARGHVGVELLRLIDEHDRLRPVLLASRSLAGERVADHVQGTSSELVFEDLEPEDVAGRPADVWVLALPNGASAPFVAAIGSSQPEAVIVDLSADHRMDAGWTYGLPEHFRESLRGAPRISNPGCYATGMQLAVRPMQGLLASPAHVFGVSGYSGAGTVPSERNDPERLRDGLLPYSLLGHVHEREATRHLGAPVHFMPHVAPFFRGITLTVSMELRNDADRDDVWARYARAYEREPLVRLVDDVPLVRDIAGAHHCEIGGLAVAGEARRAVVVATLDNLLKGAATQAMQNINLALGFDELAGIPAAVTTKPARA